MKTIGVRFHGFVILHLSNHRHTTYQRLLYRARHGIFTTRVPLWFLYHTAKCGKVETPDIIYYDVLPWRHRAIIQDRRHAGLKLHSKCSVPSKEWAPLLDRFTLFAVSLFERRNNIKNSTGGGTNEKGRRHVGSSVHLVGLWECALNHLLWCGL